jgi:hypothetical protein
MPFASILIQWGGPPRPPSTHGHSRAKRRIPDLFLPLSRRERIEGEGPRSARASRATQDSASALLSCPCVILERSEESRIFLPLSQNWRDRRRGSSHSADNFSRAIQDSAPHFSSSGAGRRARRSGNEGPPDSFAPRSRLRGSFTDSVLEARGSPSGSLARSWGEGEGEGQLCGAVVSCAAHSSRINRRTFVRFNGRQVVSRMEQGVLSPCGLVPSAQPPINRIFCRSNSSLLSTPSSQRAFSFRSSSATLTPVEEFVPLDVRRLLIQSSI